MDKPTDTEGTWLVLSTSHGKYICRTKLSISMVLQIQQDSGALECLEAFEFITPVQQVPSEDPSEMGIAKEAIATPIDTNTGAAVAFISLAGTRISFLDHLGSIDRNVYEQLVALARSMADGWRAQRSKVVVPKISLR